MLNVRPILLIASTFLPLIGCTKAETTIDERFVGTYRISEMGSESMLNDQGMVNLVRISDTGEISSVIINAQSRYNGDSSPSVTGKLTLTDGDYFLDGKMASIKIDGNFLLLEVEGDSMGLERLEF